MRHVCQPGSAPLEFESQNDLALRIASRKIYSPQTIATVEATSVENLALLLNFRSARHGRTLIRLDACSDTLYCVVQQIRASKHNVLNIAAVTRQFYLCNVGP